jgi:hypothetical protein
LKHISLTNQSIFIDIGFNMEGYDYRIVNASIFNFYLQICIYSTLINGSQIDIQAAVVYDTSVGLQTSYQHVYVVRNNIFRDDQNDVFTKNDVANLCLPNPCKYNKSRLLVPTDTLSKL